MSYNNFLFSKCRLFYTKNQIKLYQFSRNSAIYKTVYTCQQCSSKVKPTLFNNGVQCSKKLQNFAVFKRFASTNQSNKIKKLKNSDIQRLFSLAKPERWKLLGAVCLLFVSSAVSMAVPFSLGKVLDIIYTKDENIGQTSRDRLNKLCGVLIVVFMVGALCNFGRVYIMSTAGYRMTQNLRKRVFESVMKQEQGWFDTRSTGELVNRLSADTQLVGHALSSNISDGLRSTLAVVAGGGMMVYMSPELAAVGLAVVPPVAVLAVLYGRFVRQITRQVQDKLAAATQVAEERISNVRTVKTFSQENRETKSYNERVDGVLQLGYKECLARAAFFGAAGFSGNAIIISVLYYGGTMVTNETITVGSLSAFLMYAAYIGVSVGGLSSFYSELNKSVGAAERLWELMDRTPTIPIEGGVAPEKPPLGHIAFKNVKFSYPTRDGAPVLSDIQLDITPGKTVAVVGPSGSGKSTLAALLLRLYDPTGGQVILDGMDIKKLDPSWLRKHIGTVSQEPTLFACSIRDNILYGAEGHVSEERLMVAASEANVHEFVKNLPSGFDTLVGERGIMLSGGQKQRVAIARALIKDPKILLLDEATSALDAQSEHLVAEALERVMKGRTVLTIAHRLSTIRNAHTIAVLQDGKVVEIGSYDQLLSRDKSKFKELIRHQTIS